MREIPDHAAALIFDENGVWLVLPEGTDADGAGDAEPHVLAARELATRIKGPFGIAALALAFEARREDCG